MAGPKVIPSASQPIPPHLEPGDRLTRAEFERRYRAMPNVKKAELIEGIVYMPSPVRFSSHAEPQRSMLLWLGTYQAATPHIRSGGNASVRLDLDNEVQPDALMLMDKEVGGSSRLSSDDYVEGAPELIVEISASTVSYDLHAKLNVYRRNGVHEYVVWRVYDSEVDWFYLDESEYRRLHTDEAGVVCSRVFPGLWLDVPRLLQDDLAAVLYTLRQGLQSEEHAAFVAQMHAKAADRHPA